MADREAYVEPDEVERQIDELMELVHREAQGIQKARDRAVLERRRSGPVRRVTPGSRPNVESLVRADLRAALTDEVVVAPETTDAGEIQASEFEEQIMVRALMSLRMADLKDEAENLGLNWRGKEEDVAGRIARALRFDEHAIAALILKYDEEQEPERGITDRLFTLGHASIDLPAVTRIAESLVGRYVRVGPARWFVFRGVRETAAGVVVDGLLRSFRAEAAEREGGAYIAPLETSATAVVHLSRTDSIVRVRSRGIREARGALAALKLVAGMRIAATPPLAFELPPEFIDWDRRTVYLLDLVANGLAREPLHVQNYTSASFETGEGTRQVGDEIRPRIRSVRLEGDWVGDSPQACQLLMDHRTLTAIALRVRFKPNAEEIYYLPIRVALETDHISVSTALPRDGSSAAFDLQRIILDRVTQGMSKLHDARATVALRGRIEERAGASSEDATVDLFAEPERSDPELVARDETGTAEEN